MIKWIEWLLILFIFLIPWQARWVIRAGEIGSPSTTAMAGQASSGNNFWEYGTVAVYATDVLFVAIFLLGLVALRQAQGISPEQGTKVMSRRMWYWILGIGYLLLSIFWSFDKFVAFYAALKLFEGVALFLLIQVLPIDRMKLVWVFIVSAVVQSALAIAQFFTQSVFVWPFSGIASQDPSDLGVAVVQFGEERWLRAYGSFPHPNLLGAFLAIALLLFFHLTPALSSKERKVKNYPLLLGEGWVRLRWLLITGYALLVTGLFFTFSRAAWLAFLFGLIIYALQSKAWKEKIFLQLTFLLVVIAVVLTALFFPLVRTRIGGGERLEIRSSQERTAGYREAVQLIKRHPFFGVGIGNYTVAVARELRTNEPAWSYQPVHNVFLLIFSELGIVGFLLLVVFLWKIKKFIIHNSYFIIPLLILSLFDHSLWTLHSGIFLLWFSMAAAMKDSGA